ncbi:MULTISPECIES: hypothetical protein [unclassified Streptomyces]|nr:MULTISPECIES: hypothetical protein [unclassified Streptomyces]MCX5063766.1 hypothetical protein [Streptomyces sp. NBC_00452]MCX5294176.1 hypothetical protein [Streptomyces sp. NBC_00183]
MWKNNGRLFTADQGEILQDDPVAGRTYGRRVPVRLRAVPRAVS